ncbi:phospholipase A [Microbulbifer sp. SA54]|uniref:phospholipase A n=1 Tax=Microbulbifer sp. SA54 TaxID=3401577 RepID=UPI003AAC6044
MPDLSTAGALDGNPAASSCTGQCASNEVLAVESVYAEANVDGDGDGDQDGGLSEPSISRHILAISEAVDNPFSFISHRANYLLPVAYRALSPEDSLTASERYGLPSVDPVEVQFQLSMQVPVWHGFMGEYSFLSVAYTNHSFWQAYTGSGVFRETNHEAELIATWLGDWGFWGARQVVTQVGLSHQSNGRGGAFSRGWNRVYTNFLFEKDDYFLSFKPWYRLATERDQGHGPELDASLGFFELAGGYRSDGYITSIMLRNNLRSKNRGAFELSWSFPIANRLRGIVKYFDGYGESLIDYPVRVQTLGVGVELAPGF